MNHTTDTLNVKDYGAIGDGITCDAAAIIAAMTAGIATNTTVYLPAGDYFTGSTVLATPTTANGQLRVCGAGKGATRITRTNGVAATTFDIKVTGAAASVSIADLSIIGPTGLGFDNTSIGINWITGAIGHRLRVERVEVTGTHDATILSSGGGTIEVIDCDLAATDAVVSCFESTNTPDSAFFYARGGTWQTPDGDRSSQGSVGLYIHPHIPYLVNGVTFKNLGRYGIYQNGTPNAARKPGVAIGCRFINAEMAQTKADGLSVFNGCVVAGSASGLGSALGGAVVVSGCSFERTLITTGAVDSANATITGSRFTDAKLIVSGADRTIQIRGSTFVITNSYTLGGHVLQLSSGTIDLDDVLFHDQTKLDPDNPDAGAYASCLGITHTTTTTSITVRSSRLRSLGTIRAELGFIYSNRATSVTLDNSDIAGSINLAIGTAIDTWGGSNNLFRSGSISGAAILQQRFVRRVGVNPTAVGSATAIDVKTAAFLSYDTHVVTGSAVIATLGNPYPCVGILRLVVGPGGTWSTASSGNITPFTTAARKAGAVVTLLWEPITGKWLEV